MPLKKNIFTRIGKLIPGYTNYAERDDQRKTNKILRTEVNELLYQTSELLQTNILDLIQTQNFDQAKKLDLIRSKLNQINEEIKYSYYGTSTLFSAEKIKAPELLRIQENDQLVKNECENLLNILKNKPGIEQTLSSVQTAIVTLQGILIRRKNFINKYK